MLNVFITWKPFCGYFATADMKTYHLVDGCIVLYDKKGDTEFIPLESGCSFVIPLENINFKVRKNVDFTRNEVFVVRVPKKSKYDEGNNVHFYIPMDAIGLEVGENYDIKHGEDIIWTCQDLTINGDYFRTYADQACSVVVGDGKLTFRKYRRSRHTDEYERILKLTEEINENCGTHISSYDIKLICKEYAIVKR